jgi:hypothetical protein
MLAVTGGHRRSPAPIGFCREGRSGRTEQTALSSARVHLKVRVFSKLVNANEYAAVLLGRPQLRTTIVTPAPNGGNLHSEVLSRDAFTQRSAEIDPRPGIEAQIPQTVGGKPTTIAAPTERRSRGSDDSKGRTIG